MGLGVRGAPAGVSVCIRACICIWAWYARGTCRCECVYTCMYMYMGLVCAGHLQVCLCVLRPVAFICARVSCAWTCCHVCSDALVFVVFVVFVSPVVSGACLALSCAGPLEAGSPGADALGFLGVRHRLGHAFLDLRALLLTPARASLFSAPHGVPALPTLEPN